MTEALREAFRERMAAAVRYFAAAPDDSAARRELASLLAYGPGAATLFDTVLAELTDQGAIPRAAQVSLKAFAIHVRRTAARHSVSPAWLDLPPDDGLVDDTILRDTEDDQAATTDESDQGGQAGEPPTGEPPTPADTSESADALLPAGTLCADRYVIDEAIAVGGMSTVYRATDNRDGRRVALKVLRRSMADDPDLVASFEREADNAWTLHHPNLVPVLAQGWIGPQPFLALEYLDGQDLGTAMKGTFATGAPWPVARRILEQVGSAVAHAHRRGLVHADLKPGNIFILENGDARVLDLGAAQVVQGEHRVDHDHDEDPSGGALTPAYASPEMLLGAPAQPRDDVFSLAVIGYELVAGRHPFDRYTADRARHLDIRPARPPGLPAQAWRTLRRGLALHRARRPASMAAFVAELRQPFPRVTVAIGLLVLIVLAGLGIWSRYHPQAAQAHWTTGEHAVGLAIDLAGLRPLPRRPADSILLAHRLAQSIGWTAPLRSLVDQLALRVAPATLAHGDFDALERAVDVVLTLRPISRPGDGLADAELAVTHAILARASDLIDRTNPLPVDAISHLLELLAKVDPDGIRVVGPHLTDLLNERRRGLTEAADRAEFDRLAAILVARFPIVPPPVVGPF